MLCPAHRRLWTSGTAHHLAKGTPLYGGCDDEPFHLRWLASLQDAFPIATAVADDALSPCIRPVSYVDILSEVVVCVCVFPMVFVFVLDFDRILTTEDDGLQGRKC